MECIFCRTEQPESLEHIIPLALGGCITTRRVCRDCNSYLGNKIDNLLIDHPLMLIQRHMHDLGGNRGTVPDALIKMMENAILPQDGDRRVKIVKREDGKYQARTILRRQQKTLDNGDLVEEISMDPGDFHLLPGIINGVRKKNALPILNDQELADAVEEAMSSVTSIDNPDVHSTISIDLINFRKGILKIAYELGFLWFGEEFLDLPEAGVMRKVLRYGADLDASGIRCSFDLHSGTLFDLWKREPHHLAYSVNAGGRVHICIRLFNSLSGVIDMGPARSLPLGDFLRNDFKKKSFKLTKLWREIFIISTSLYKSGLLFGAHYNNSKITSGEYDYLMGFSSTYHRLFK